MTNKISDKAFEEELQARFRAASQTTTSGTMGKMHMNELPSGANKSLDMLLDGDAQSDAHEGTPPQYSMDPDQTVPIPLDDIVDSPWQPRLTYDETKLQRLASGMKTNGQQERIKVRRLANGKFQLIAGHRRTRAARLLQWKTINAVIVEVDDRDAEIQTLTSNENREDLSDWERAEAYQQAKNSKLATTQEEIAAMFGCSQARVSQCLSMMALPIEIRELLMKYPALFGYRFVKVIKTLAEDHPDDLPIVVQSVEQLIDSPDLESSQIVRYVKDTLARRRSGEARSSGPTDNRTSKVAPQPIRTRSGREVFVVRMKEDELVIKFKPGVDKDSTASRTLELLKQISDEFEV